jgi:hypothetical protein
MVMKTSVFWALYPTRQTSLIPLIFSPCTVDSIVILLRWWYCHYFMAPWLIIKGLDCMIGFINAFVYNISLSQSIIALSLIYPLHKSLGHAKSSQSSLLVSWQRICNSPMLSLLFTGWLSTDDWSEPTYDWTGLTIIIGFSLYSLESDHSTENIRCLAMDICERHRKHI